MRPVPLVNLSISTASAIIAFAGSLALAAIGTTSSAHTLIDPTGNVGPSSIPDDYTIPPDGHKYLWQISYTSADPDAKLELDPVSETNLLLLSGPNGSDITLAPTNPVYIFDETFTPGLTSIIVKAQAQYNNCTASTPSGVICGDLVQVWGNGTSIRALSTSPVTFENFTVTAVPEPSTWLLSLAGLGVVGAALRVRASRRPLTT